MLACVSVMWCNKNNQGGLGFFSLLKKIFLSLVLTLFMEGGVHHVCADFNDDAWTEGSGGGDDIIYGNALPMLDEGEDLQDTNDIVSFYIGSTAVEEQI